jgi:hypothetical protein
MHVTPWGSPCIARPLGNSSPKAGMEPFLTRTKLSAMCVDTSLLYAGAMTSFWPLLCNREQGQLFKVPTAIWLCYWLSAFQPAACRMARPKNLVDLLLCAKKNPFPQICMLSLNACGRSADHSDSSRGVRSSRLSAEWTQCQVDFGSPFPNTQCMLFGRY